MCSPILEELLAALPDKNNAVRIYYKECYEPYERWLHCKSACAHATGLMPQTNPVECEAICGPEPPVPPGFLAWFANRVRRAAGPGEEEETWNQITGMMQDCLQKMLQVDFGLSEDEAREPDLLTTPRLLQAGEFWKMCVPTTVARRTEQPMEPIGTTGNPTMWMLWRAEWELLL